MIDQHLVADIKHAEGCKLAAYRDTKNLWTIGWGHLLDQTKDWTGHSITQEQADDWLNADIASAIAYATNLREWPSLDTPCRQNAISELCFNMRARWLLFQSTRDAICAKNWKAAHDGLLNSLWAHQVGTTRSERIAGYLLTGQYAQ